MEKMMGQARCVSRSRGRIGEHIKGGQMERSEASSSSLLLLSRSFSSCGPFPPPRSRRWWSRRSRAPRIVQNISAATAHPLAKRRDRMPYSGQRTAARNLDARIRELPNCDEMRQASEKCAEK